MNIKILGSGCRKCSYLEERVRKLIEEGDIQAEVEKVTDLGEIMKYGILMTPGLVVDGVVKSEGVLPTEKQILGWIAESR